MPDFFDAKISERLGGKKFGKSTVIYKFEIIKRAKAAARLAHPEMSLIDMGVGEPDWPAHDLVVKKLAKEAGKPENRWYSDNGIPEFQEAAAEYLEKVYGIKDLVPSENIVHGIGSKPVLAMLPICFINPGDILLTTVPGYPVSATYTNILEERFIIYLYLNQIISFRPGFKPDSILKKAKLLYINYPNNQPGQ
jgi:LL-diaminopimelate aminotransferase